MTATAKPLPAVVMAAGGPQDPLCELLGAPGRAEIPVADVPMVVRTVDALSAASSVREVCVAVPPGRRAEFETLPWSGRPQFAEVGEGAGHVGSILAALEPFLHEERVLVLTCDLPLLRPEMVDDFAAEALASGAELCYSVVRYQRCRDLWPGTERTSVRLRDGRFTGGNIVLVAPELIQRQADRIEAAFQARKHPLRLGRWLGFGFLLRFAAGFCSLDELAARGGELLDCRACVVQSEHAEIAFDVDKATDLQEAERILRGGRERE